MSEAISGKDRLLIEASQWLGVLVEEFGLDPEAMVMETRVVTDTGALTLEKICLSDTLAQLEAMSFKVKTTALNDE